MLYRKQVGIMSLKERVYKRIYCISLFSFLVITFKLYIEENLKLELKYLLLCYPYNKFIYTVI